MKKLLCILCLLLALVCVLAACDGEKPNTDQDNAQNGGTQTPGGDDEGGQNATHTHAFGEWTVSKSATCTEAGEEKRVCTCGESETRVLEKTAHAFGAWTQTKPATESEKGEEKRTCACGAFETREIPVLGHVHTYGAWSVVTPATCGAKGEEKRVCAGCAAFETREILATGVHTYGDWGLVTPATCGTPGEEKRVCSGCVAFETREILATGEHTYGDWGIVTPATCSTQGEEKRVCSGCVAFETREVSATGEHTYGAWGIVTPATCVNKGEEKRTCTGCIAFEVRDVLATGVHTYGEWMEITPATCGAAGEEKRICTGCIAFETREIPATDAHVYVQGVCVCGAVERIETDFYVREGNKIYFGSYPQSDVTDAALISVLNSVAGDLPTAENAQSWTSYGYYTGGTVQDYMWYIDVTHSGERYRGVYFTSYRPQYPGNNATIYYSRQDDNGYFINVVYWFKYEPIAWRILQEANGTALLLCDIALDAQAYQNQYRSFGPTNYTDYNGAPANTYANNYAYSMIRTWLNESFLETAFTDLQRHIILTTTVDNSLASTGDDDNRYVCINTQDKVFLVSVADMMNEAYGFSNSVTGSAARQRYMSAYAKAQGGAVHTYLEYDGQCNWMLRTPYWEYTQYERTVGEDGRLQYAYTYVFDNCIGVVPALRISLSSTLDAHVCGEWQTVAEPSCGAVGKEQRTCSCGEIETREIPATGAHIYGTWDVFLSAGCGTVGEERRICTGCPAFETREIPATGAHVYGNWGVTAPATCEGAGEEKRTCTVCIAFETRELPATGHLHIVSHEAVSATCKGVGNVSYWECGDCLGYFSDAACQNEIVDKASTVLAATGVHSYNSAGVCTVCNASKGYTRDGEKIYFGSYPQTKVTSSSLIDKLNAKAGILPTKENARNWISYGYFNKGEADDYMWYIDLTYGGETYRGVYFTSYRPSSASDAISSSNGNQKNNGYAKNVVYWFQYEPIAWNVLTQRDGIAFLLCDMVIDAREFDYEVKNDYSNNYAESTIRAWLNDTFLETAFTELQQKLILTTTVDNSAASTGYTNNPYACENTQDKIFLPSVVELTTADYGFWPSYSTNDVARRKQATGYALSQGVAARMDTSYSTYGNAFWWLRSPLYRTAGYARYVNLDGVIGDTAVYATSAGIVPALKLGLEESNQPLYEREGNTIYFGSYPQSRVTDATLTAELKAKAGPVPTSTNPGAWTSYRYYTGVVESDYMWYVDVSLDGEYYRGVYARFYRPYEIGKIATNRDYSYFDENGYDVGNVYWFKYEPIAWTVLEEANGEALLLCNMILDSRQFDFDTSSSNNYAESTIRAWLNEVFYETAFNDLCQEIILAKTVDNSVASTGVDSNRYACENTQDKVFLLSAQEATSAKYGFSTSGGDEDAARRKKTTDYAQAQGAYTNKGGSYQGTGMWWLRSPANNSAACVCGVFSGNVGNAYETDYTCTGVVPAIWIRL